MILKIILEMKGCPWKTKEDRESNPNRRGGFLNAKKRDMFPNSIRDKGGGYSNHDEFGIPSFNGNLDVESSLLWID